MWALTISLDEKRAAWVIRGGRKTGRIWFYGTLPDEVVESADFAKTVVERVKNHPS